MILRLFIIALFVLTYVIVSSIICLFLFWSQFFRRRVISSLLATTCKLCLKILKFEIHVDGTPPSPGTLVISNHLSYLDILVLKTQFKSLFVTSVDMKQRLFLGQLTQLGGSLYVERRNPMKLKEELSNIKTFFDKGFTVCIFPEGTSSNGDTVLPFKKSLLELAIQTKALVQPTAIHYSEVNGKAFSKENADSICWYGDIPFFPHLIGLCKMKSVKVNLSFLKPIEAPEFPDRKSLSDALHAQIVKKYQSFSN